MYWITLKILGYIFEDISLSLSLSPVLVLVVVMGSMELKIARLFSCSFSGSVSLFAFSALAHIFDRHVLTGT